MSDVLPRGIRVPATAARWFGGVRGFRDRAGESEWSTDATPTAAVQDMLESFLRSHIGVTAPITHRWAACAGYTDTGLPVIEQVRERVWALGGYSGTGNVIGALAARGVAAAALDGDPSGIRTLLGDQWSTAVTHGALRDDSSG